MHQCSCQRYQVLDHGPLCKHFDLDSLVLNASPMKTRADEPKVIASRDQDRNRPVRISCQGVTNELHGEIGNLQRRGVDSRMQVYVTIYLAACRLAGTELHSALFDVILPREHRWKDS